MDNLTSNSLRKIFRGESDGIVIRPSFLSPHVAISDIAWARLKQAQTRLPKEVQIILYRGYQPRSVLRYISRQIGAAFFRVLFPTRRDEIIQIFSANGHECDGNHIDIGLSLHGKNILFLPLSVFTPQCLQKRLRNTHRLVVDSVQQEMCRAGFVAHENATEALVMHFDLVS